MRLAICFLTTSNITHLAAWERWWSGHEHQVKVYAHFSKRGKITQDTLLQTRVPPVPTRWGDISLVKAEAQLYKRALQSPKNVAFLLASAACVPVRSFAVVYTKVMRDLRRGLVTYRTTAGYAGARVSPFVPRCQPLLDRYGLSAATCYACDQWKILSRQNAKDFVAMWRDKAYVRLFSKACIRVVPDSLAPDEIMFINWLKYRYGTLRTQVRNQVVTWVMFSGDAIHPHNYHRIETRTARNMCDAGALFARKFQDASPEMLERSLPLHC
jgi:hypothetical protein